MDQIREQMDISNEISDAISNPVNMGIDVDDVSFPLSVTDLDTDFDTVMSRRRSSRTNWKSWSKSSSTTVLWVPNGLPCIPWHRQRMPSAENVSLIVLSCRAWLLIYRCPTEAKQIEEEDDEEAQLRQLQAEMAM
jgi:charged multivesicular body protein 4